MKVFTFYSNRFDSATTSLALEENGIDHTVLVHSRDQAQGFLDSGRVKGKMVITNEPPGLAFQRNAALNLMEKGEWAVFMCDDFLYCRALPREWIESKTLEIPVSIENQEAFRFRNANKISLSEMFSHFPMLIKIAEANGIFLIGFALHDNPLLLRKKFSHYGLADGRFWIVRKSFYRFDTNAQLIDDVAWTAENLVRHKKVLILNWMEPKFRRYTSGGFGSIEERLVQRRKECAYLERKFSPLVKRASKRGWPEGTHIRIFATERNIAAARRKLRIV